MKDNDIEKNIKKILYIYLSFRRRRLKREYKISKADKTEPAQNSIYQVNFGLSSQQGKIRRKK